MPRIVEPHLNELRQTVLRMGSLSEAILDKSLKAFWARDAALAAEVQEDDLDIDRLDVELDEHVLRLLATQAPVANDLREVIAGKMIAVDLERVGDLARNVAQAAARLAERPAATTPPLLRTLAEESQRILRHSLDAFTERDPARAAQVLEDDDQVDRDEDEVIRAAIEEIRSHPEYAAQEVRLHSHRQEPGAGRRSRNEHRGGRDPGRREARIVKHAGKLAG